MDFAIAANFCKRHAIKVLDDRPLERFEAMMPFCWVVIEPVPNYPQGKRVFARATISGATNFRSPWRHHYVLKVVKAAALDYRNAFYLGGDYCLYLSSNFDPKSVSLGCTLYEKMARPEENLWRATFNGGSRHWWAAIDVLRGEASPEQFLDWALQQDELPGLDDLRRALSLIYS